MDIIKGVIKIQLGKLLKAKGKTLYWLAKQTGITYNALSKINKNEVTRLELDTIEKIYTALECKSIADLIEVQP